MNRSHTKFTKIISLVIIIMLSLSHLMPIVYATETLESDKTSEIVESEEDKANKEVLEEPSKKVLETKVGRTTVKIEYNSGVFPEGVVLKAEKIEDERRTQTIEKAIKEESAQSVSEMEALDISVLLNNEEVQPDVSKGNVKVIISGNGIDKDVKVYHFEDDENSKVKKETSKVAEDNLEFEVEYFSVVAWAKLSGYTSDDKDIYVTWDSDTTTIALTWDKLEDGTESVSISNLKSFISKYKDNVTTIDFSLRDENGNQVSIMMPEDSSRFFYSCNHLTNIIGEEYFNTSNVTSMAYMFYGCSNLTEIDLRSFNTSNVTYMNSMFSRCSNLTEIDLRSFNTSNVTSMSFMFYGCSNLTEIDLRSFNTSNVTDMYNMFNNCSNLTEIDLRSFNTSNVTRMDNMFDNCSNLTGIDLRSFNTSNVTNMYAMFYGCSNLTGIDLRSFNTSNVTNMDYMFDGCSNLTEIDLGSFNTSNVTSMTYMFVGCKLNKIILGKDITKDILSTLSTNWYKIPEGTLYTHLSNVYDGSTMAGIYVKELPTAGLYAVWDEVNKTVSIKNINDATDITENDYIQIKNIKSFISKYKSKVEKIDFTYDEKIALAKTDGTGLFKDCTNLKEIKGIGNLDVSNIQDMSSMFENCTSLTNIDVNWDSGETGKTIIMNSMFKNCSSLVSVTGLSYYGQELKDTTSMFEGCASLTNIDLKNTAASGDMSSMFKNCTSLKNLDLHEFSTFDATNMSSMFEDCTSLETLELTKVEHDVYGYVSYFMTYAVTDMSNMFKNCNSLTNLDLRGFDMTSLEENGMQGMFSGLSSLQRIALGGFEKLDLNCGLEGDTWLKLNSGEVYTASELIEVYNSDMADVYLNGILEKHYYVSSSQSLDNLYEVHSPDKPFTGYCINLYKFGFGTYLDRLDTNDNSTLESLLDTPEEGGVHGYEPLGNNMKEALITLMYYGYPNDGTGIMEKYNLTESQYADITQEAIWDFTDRYGNPSGPTKYTGDELLAYNELVSQKYSNIENSDSLLFYVYKSWDETQQNMISIMSVANDIYGGVEVTKVDKNGNPLAGAEFTITNEYTGETRTIVSNANGIASICRTDEKEGLPAGIYAVEETKAPKGYNLTSDYYEFEISEANQIVTIGYKNGVPDERFMKFIDDEDESVVGGGLTITKKTNNGNVLANVEFDIYTDSLCTNKISTLKTDANGVAQSGRKDFEPGKYYVKETKAPYGYKLNETVFEVTITGNQFAELEVSNEAKKGKASIVVKKELNGANIADYTFTFELIDYSGNVIQTKTNDKDGVVKFDEIEYTTADGTYKNYTVREVIGDLVGITYDEHEELITVTIRDDGEDNLICTPVYDGDGAVFTNIAEQLNINVSKVWQHYDSKQEYPTSITVNLLADGVKIKSQELSEDNSWRYTFEGLNKYTVEGKEIIYAVTEDEISGYTSKITGNVSDGFIITNTYVKDESKEEDEEIDKDKDDEKEEKGDNGKDELEEEKKEETKKDNQEVEQKTETSETEVIGTLKTGDFIVISVVMLVFTVLSLGVIIKLKKDDKK